MTAVQGTGTEPTTSTPLQPADLERELERYRSELTGYCYRMLGSAFEAEDAVQETMVRAWRSLDRFEGRSALRTWLYRIATNVCFDLLHGRQRRALPMDLGPAQPADTRLVTRPEATWIEPIPDNRVIPSGTEGDPAEVAAARESVRLAFVAALAHLPPKQRAVLILREVLRWKADEVAELLDTTVASVNSALQRARATMAASDIHDTDPIELMDEEQQQLLGRYVDAFQRFDVETLVSLLHADAQFSMPPFDLWLQGTEEIRAFYLGPGSDCRGSRMVPVSANGTPAFGQYKPKASGAGYYPWSVQVIEVSQGRIVGLHHFLDTERMFPLFGLPLELEA